MKILIWCFLFVGFLLLFRKIRWVKVLRRMWLETKTNMDEASGRRQVESREGLLTMKRENSLWFRLERQLTYSGWKLRLPFLTAELWVLINVVFLSAVFLIILLLSRNLLWTALVVGAVWAGEYLLLLLCKERAMHSVNSNLLRFLDFLGNYSITAGEITYIFSQVSKYLDEPLRTVLEECSYEAQTTGDTQIALLSMAEKVEHPKFRELARNLEISIRYCADFTILVNSSRRSVREYLRMADERKNLLRESAINMLLLLAMSGFVLLTVDGLITTSIWKIVTDTLPGRIGMGVLALIAVLFCRQAYGINRDSSY